jgi:hypothetical protein
MYWRTDADDEYKLTLTWLIKYINNGKRHPDRKKFWWFCIVADSDQDPYVFGPPGSGSGSVSRRYGSVSGSGPFYPQAKIVRKTLIPTVL